AGEHLHGDGAQDGGPESCDREGDGVHGRWRDGLDAEHLLLQQRAAGRGRHLGGLRHAGDRQDAGEQGLDDHGDGAGVAGGASDNVGVIGVQFQLDGAPLGLEVRAAPYTLGWDTTAVPDGPHALTAVARDAAGNVATSAAVTVTVLNGTTPLVVSAVAASST